MNFLLGNKASLLLWMIFILSSGSAHLFGQSQNPFDIRSRTAIDTTKSSPKKDEVVPVKEKDTTKPQPKKNEIPEPATEVPPQKDQKKDTAENAIPDSVLKKSEDPEPSKADPDDVINKVEIPEDQERIEPPKGRSPIITSSPAIEIPAGQKWWVYIFDLVLLLLVAAGILYDKDIFPNIRKAFIHENYLRFLYRDTYQRKLWFFFFLNFIFILCFGLFLFKVGLYLGMADTFKEYLIIQSVVIFLFLLKHGFLYLLAQLIDNSFEVEFYQYWMLLATSIIGLGMLPLTLMISVLPHPYLRIGLIITGILLAGIILYRHLKAMQFGRFFLSKHFFHFFLYFCAVEIIPIMVFMDILTHN